MAHTIKIKGMPLAIPDDITVDVTPLELTSHGITCADLAIPDNVTLEDELDKVCVSVVAPKAAEEEAEEEEAAEAEEGAEETAEGEEPAPAAEE